MGLVVDSDVLQFRTGFLPNDLWQVGVSQPPIQLAAAPQALQAGIEVRCMTNYIFFAFKPLKRFRVSCVEKPLCACFRGLRKRGVCLLVGEDISCVTQYNYLCL